MFFRLETYDDDKKIPVYGFGAKFNGNTNVSHLHPLNNNFEDVYISYITYMMFMLYFLISF